MEKLNIQLVINKIDELKENNSLRFSELEKLFCEKLKFHWFLIIYSWMSILILFTACYGHISGKL